MSDTVPSITDVPMSVSAAHETQPLSSGSSAADVVEIPIAALRKADSPRLDGIDHEHARLLAQLTVEPPPILVNGSTMRVIDGMHRLYAAIRNGRSRINAVFFHGSEEDAFLLGVRANVTHGLPLTLADRRVAAERIVRSHPRLSNRSIALTAGLAAKTVAAIRERVTTDGGETDNARIGRDGRVRPLDSSEGRRLAGAVIAAQPNASLREIAREAGISIGTARDVRDRMMAGEDPVLPRKRVATHPVPAPRLPRAAPGPATEADVLSILHGLRRDPSLRYTQAGRSLLKWLDSHLVLPTGWEDMVADIPPHSRILISKAARGCAATWLRFADDLLRTSNEEPSHAS